MPQPPAVSRLIHFIVSALLAFIALAIILVLAFPIGFYGMAMYLEPELPSVSKMQTARLEMPLQIYSKDNKLIGQYGNRMSLPVTYEEIPENFINAFLAAEDSSFYEHSGISIKGLGRAVTEIITDDDGQTGGSTITMQVAKNYFLSPERTFSRKLTELYLARSIEQELSKEEILTLYVNKIYMGEGAYGIRAAAKKYFSKSLESLSIAEMATLAGLPKAPSQNNPVSNPEEALERRNWILGRMLELGYITQAEHNEAVNSPIGVHLYKEQLDVNMPYLAEMTRSALVDRYGSEVMNAGWRVKLTVDSEDQNAADTAIKKGLIGYDRRHGWRGVEASGEPLENFVTYSNMVPAKVTEVASRSFKAQLQNGDIVTVPWSGMSWAKLYLDANRIKGYPGRASDLVKKDDIVRLIANESQTSWRLTQVPKVQGSLVALDPETGAVEALVGGFDYRHSKFNRATQGWRQPGSTIKPLNYAAALEKGYRPDSLISDGPLRIGSWRPKNADGRYYGNMTLRQGLILSRNLVSIRLLQAVGTEDARQLLNQFGLDKDKLPTTLSLALGAGQATPLQMATAYATFANGGHRVQPYLIDQIYDYNNKLLYLANPQRACALCFNERLDKYNAELEEAYEEQAEAELKQREEALKALENKAEETDAEGEDSELQASMDDLRYDASPKSDRLKPAVIRYSPAEQAPRILSPAVSYEMAGMMRDVIQRGTAKRARALGRSDVGGKTGTTNEMKDAWFAGFHPTQVTIVWLGFDQPSTLGRGEYGGVAALPMWVDYMRHALKSTPYQWVSVNNKAKSETQKQEVVNLGEDSDDDKKPDTKNDSRITNQRVTGAQPPKAAVSERKPPEPPPEPENSDERKSNAARNSNSESSSDKKED
ncbi:penicillin-binding protein 1A [Psychrobacter sp. FDAARGOS_221]|uniref:penicillin-binding protein 1A n=1 Tax=Psychrobacter sp. FDAARGOS_221 TaxID=1975705 RepID=UPI000BB567C3|nr:PBP1A family penicillin-binding protein [Psychrobacter sp. FDAARGOS_221]PNK60362.1 penicillin-binding protein 1A [Psychrobacter sp. FDAARGOS_221]